LAQAARAQRLPIGPPRRRRARGRPMAPKGLKRAAGPHPQEPAAKQAFDPLKEYDVSRQTFEGAISALHHPALADLGVNEDCRQMLLVAAPLSLCVPADQRHAHQRLAVEMIGEVSANVESRLDEAVAAEQAALEALEASKATLESRASAAKEELTAVSAAADARKQDLDGASAAMMAARRALSERQEEQRRAAAGEERARQDQEALRSALEGPFARLRDGSWEGDEAKALYGAVGGVLPKLSLDESLVTALPSSTTKRPEERGAFDKMVVEQLQLGLEGRIRELCAAIAAAGPEGQQRASATEQAQVVLAQATEAQQAAASELNLAQAKRREALAEMDAARSEVAGFEPRRKAAEDARNSKRVALLRFHDDCLAPFRQLRDRGAIGRDIKEAASVAGA